MWSNTYPKEAKLLSASLFEDGYTIPNPKYIMLYVGRVNYVVSLVSLTSLLDRRSEDLEVRRQQVYRL